MAAISSTSFPKVSTTTPAYSSPLPTDRKYTILIRHTNDYAKFIEAIPVGTTYLPLVLAKHVAGYVADGVLFDRAMWKEYFEIDIGEETPEVQEYLRFDKFYKEVFHAPNPIDLLNGIPVEKARRVCESCLLPVVRPETVTLPDGRKVDFCLLLLGNLTPKTKKGHSAGYERLSGALKQNGMKKAGPMRVIIMLEDLVARGKPWSCESPEPLKQGQVQYLKMLNDKTGFGCMEEPRGIDQNTAVMVHYVVTRIMFLGDYTETGKEEIDCARTCEDVEVEGEVYKMLTSFFHELKGSSVTARLDVFTDNLIETSVAVLGSSSVKPKSQLDALEFKSGH